MMKKASMLFFLLCFALYYHQVLSANRIDQQDVNSNSKEADSLKLNSVNPNLKMTPSPESASGWLQRSHSEKQRYHHGRRYHIYHEEKASEYFPVKANLYHHHHHRRHHHHHHHHKRGHHNLPVPEAQFSSKILVKARSPYEHHYQHHPKRLDYHVLDPMETAQFPFEFAVAAPHPDENCHDHHHHHQHKKPHHIYSQSSVKLHN